MRYKATIVRPVLCISPCGGNSVKQFETKDIIIETDLSEDELNVESGGEYTIRGNWMVARTEVGND